VIPTSVFNDATGICASEAVAKSSAPALKKIAEVRAEKVFIKHKLPRPEFSNRGVEETSDTSRSGPRP
jgi:hypothetical protein